MASSLYAMPLQEAGALGQGPKPCVHTVAYTSLVVEDAQPAFLLSLRAASQVLRATTTTVLACLKKCFRLSRRGSGGIEIGLFL